MNKSEIAKLLGAAGGSKTAALYGKNHYKEAQKLSVLAKKAKKENLSTAPLLTTASK